MLGAWITILMLGLQPFVQQTVNVVDYKWINVTHPYQFKDPASATVPRAYTLVNSSSFVALGEDWVPPFFQVPVYQGFSSNLISSSQVTVRCPRSNCTWEPYHTLAVCASTANITESIVKNCTDLEVLSSPNVCQDFTGHGVTSHSCSNSTYLGPENCTWTVPDFDIMNANQRLPMETTSSNSSELWVAVNKPFASADHAHYESNLLTANPAVNRATFAEVYILARDYNRTYFYPDDASLQRQKPPFAYKVSLGFCIQELHTVFINGTSNTTIISQDINPQWQEDVGQGYWITVDDFHGSRKYSVLPWFLNTLGDYMGALFNGNASFHVDHESDLDRWSAPYQSSQMMDMLAPDAFFGLWPDNVGIPRGMVIESRFNNIAQSITNA